MKKCYVSKLQGCQAFGDTASATLLQPMP